MRGRQGFSLLELLVVAALLALVGVLILQVIGAISRATRLSAQGVDAAAQARLAFDRIGQDLAHGVMRRDVDFGAAGTKAPADSFLALLSGVPSADAGSAGFTNRRMSLVSYRLAPHADNGGRRCLVRGARPGVGDADFMGLQTTGLASNLPVAFTATNYSHLPAAVDHDVLSPAVIQAAVGFQLRPDNAPVMLADGTSLAQARGQVVYSPPVRRPPGETLVDAGRIATLVVGLVVIDPERLKLLDPATLDQLAAAFSAAPDPGQLPVARWMADTGRLANLPAGVPLPVRQSVRVYQRFFPLP